VYLSLVLSGRFPIYWTSLIAITFVMVGHHLRADDPPAASDGYKTVPVAVGDKTVSIRVKEGKDPFKNVSSSNSTGKYDPQRIFSASNSLANKTFSLPSESLSQTNSDFKNRDQDTFITKSYIGDNSTSVPNLNTKVNFPAAAGYNQNAAGFDKNYTTSNADAGQNRTAMFASPTTSADQNRTAVLGGSDKAEVLAANSMAHKQYLGPGAQHVPDDVTINDNIVISRMSGLPDRPLSIDEVRNLINHETKPNTDAKPEEPSKPLNDPNYKPEPLRDSPSPASDDDKSDPVPPPGTMASPQTPENSEPLPQP
jgi:hypothetical protein